MMAQPSFPTGIRHEGRQHRPIRAVVVICLGFLLITAGILLALKAQGIAKSEGSISHPARASSASPAASISTMPSANGTSPTPGNPVPANPDELGQTLEEFQAEYESLSSKGGGQEAFFKKAVGKKVLWKVRVDHVFRTSSGVIVVFSSTERPDWAAFPISDARFPIRLEKQLMTLSRGDIIRIEGKIVYHGIKTLECSYFEMVRS